MFKVILSLIFSVALCSVANAWVFDGGWDNGSVAGSMTATAPLYVTSSNITLDVYALNSGWTKSGANVYATSSADSIGIGDSTPDAKLEVTPTLMVSSTSAGDGDRLIVSSSGNVGIGTASPRGSLDVRLSPGVDGFIYGNGSQLTGIVGGSGLTHQQVESRVFIGG